MSTVAVSIHFWNSRSRRNGTAWNEVEALLIEETVRIVGDSVLMWPAVSG
jgi:hypothetical protein